MFEFYLLLIAIFVVVTILVVILFMVKNNRIPVHPEEEGNVRGDLYVDEDILKDHKVFSDDDVFEDKKLAASLLNNPNANKKVWFLIIFHIKFYL